MGHNKVNLAKGPIEYDAKDNEKPDGEPCNHRRVGFIVVHAKFLLPTVKVESCFVFCDSSRC
jgi:hypothetical protein